MNSRVKASYFSKYTDWLNNLQLHQIHIFPLPRSEREIPRSTGKGRAGACIPGGGAAGPDEEPPLVGIGLRSEASPHQGRLKSVTLSVPGG
jgi:hypothetical protein